MGQQQPFKNLVRGLEDSAAFCEILREEDASSAEPNIGFRNDLKHLAKLIRIAGNFAHKLQQKRGLR